MWIYKKDKKKKHSTNITALSCVVVQPPLRPGDPRTSQHCILACTAGVAGWCALNWDHLALACLRTRAVSWPHQALPDRTWISCCLESHPPGKCQSCTLWVVLGLSGCCLHHVGRDQDGRSLMPGVNRLEALGTPVPRTSLRALPVRSGLRPVTPSDWDASQSNPRAIWTELLETQPLPAEKSFDLKWVFHWTRGEFLWSCTCACENRFKTYYSFIVFVITNCF